MSKELIYLMSFVLVLAVTGSASADQWEITIPDAGFEDHVLAKDGNLDVADPSYTGAWESQSALAWVDYLYWAANGWPEDLPAHGGNNKMYPFLDNVYQILDETYIEGGTYTLKAWICQPWEGYASGWRLYLTGDDHENELAQASGTSALVWEQISLTFTATAAEAGKKIGIKMWSNEEVSFDDLTLSYDGPAGNLRATNPTPADGVLIEDTWATLNWVAAVSAVSHDLYMADNFDDVNDRAAAAFQGSRPSASVLVGFAGFPIPDGLVPGATYYWAVDEVEADGATKHKGAVWSFSIQSKSAYDPNPSDGEQYVAPDVTLGWTPGYGAKLHTVYIGDSFEDVNNATGGTPMAGATFAPATLELDKTYYWRVDESDPPNPAVKGEVWSFTTTLPELGAAVMERWENIAGTDLNALKNNPRFPYNPDVNETVEEFLWNGADIDEYGARIEAWLYVPVTGEYTFWLATDDSGQLWLSTDEDPGGVEMIARVPGYSDVEEWMKFASQQSAPVPLVAGERYYIAALWKEGGGGDHCNVAWEGPGIPTRTTIPGNYLSPFEPVNAFSPQPANGAVDVTQTPTLRWSPALAAASHEVYFGADADAVANATKASPEYVGAKALGDESYATSMLDWSTAYYWRVDQINPGDPDSPWVGKVWSFTTADYGIVDDFEPYNDIPSGEPGSNLIYETWVDGFEIPANGSTIGYTVAFQPTMETATVHGGGRSAPMEYNNVGVALSEVTRTFAAQNWTDNDVQTLSLWFYGDPANTPGQLYVKINGVQVIYEGDSANLSQALWQVWNIDLASVSVNLQSVTSLAVGVQGSGATGTLLLDDIGLHRAALDVGASNAVVNGGFEYWSDHPDDPIWAYVTTIQDDPAVAWYVHDSDDGGSGPWLDDGYSGYGHIVGTAGDRIAVISWGDTNSTISQDLGVTFVEGETYTFSIDIFGDGGGGEHWAIGIGAEGMSNRGALERQRGALAVAASNAVVGDNYSADPGDYTVLSPPDVFSGWQTRSVSYTATAADAGKRIVVFISGGFQEVGADGDTCFDNAVLVVGPGQ
ncbi:MAG: PA14 domain-containing protein [Planctomycetota bacterium]|jgi:hypothetical protein